LLPPPPPPLSVEIDAATDGVPIVWSDEWWDSLPGFPAVAAKTAYAHKHFNSDERFERDRIAYETTVRAAWNTAAGAYTSTVEKTILLQWFPTFVANYVELWRRYYVAVDIWRNDRRTNAAPAYRQKSRKQAETASAAVLRYATRAVDDFVYDRAFLAADAERRAAVRIRATQYVADQIAAIRNRPVRGFADANRPEIAIRIAAICRVIATAEFEDPAFARQTAVWVLREQESLGVDVINSWNPLFLRYSPLLESSDQ